MSSETIIGILLIVGIALVLFVIRWAVSAGVNKAANAAQNAYYKRKNMKQAQEGYQSQNLGNRYAQPGNQQPLSQQFQQAPQYQQYPQYQAPQGQPLNQQYPQYQAPQGQPLNQQYPQYQQPQYQAPQDPNQRP